MSVMSNSKLHYDLQLQALYKLQKLVENHWLTPSERAIVDRMFTEMNDARTAFSGGAESFNRIPRVDRVLAHMVLRIMTMGLSRWTRPVTEV